MTRLTPYYMNGNTVYLADEVDEYVSELNSIIDLMGELQDEIEYDVVEDDSNWSENLDTLINEEGWDDE